MVKRRKITKTEAKPTATPPNEPEIEIESRILRFLVSQNFCESRVSPDVSPKTCPKPKIRTLGVAKPEKAFKKKKKHQNNAKQKDFRALRTTEMHKHFKMDDVKRDIFMNFFSCTSASKKIGEHSAIRCRKRLRNRYKKRSCVGRKL